MPWPPRRVTSSAVSSMVPGAPSAGLGPERVVRPVTYTVAPASPSARAMPRPQPLLAPATTATLPLSESRIVSKIYCAGLADKPRNPDRIDQRPSGSPPGHTRGLDSRNPLIPGRLLRVLRPVLHRLHRARLGSQPYPHHHRN